MFQRLGYSGEQKCSLISDFETIKSNVFHSSIYPPSSWERIQQWAGQMRLLTSQCFHSRVRAQIQMKWGSGIVWQGRVQWGHIGRGRQGLSGEKTLFATWMQRSQSDNGLGGGWRILGQRQQCQRKRPCSAPRTKSCVNCLLSKWALTISLDKENCWPCTGLRKHTVQGLVDF